MKPLGRFAALAGMLLLCGCTTISEPITDFDENYDFSAVDSVAIRAFERVSEAELLISDMQVERINAVLGDLFRAKGYAVAHDAAQADMVLTWHLVSREKTAIRSYNAMAFYNCWRCGPSASDISIDQYTQGTFIVDMVDPVMERSVWRGLVQSDLSITSKADIARLEHVARAACRDFPSRSGS